MALIDHFLPALAFAAMLASEENLADTPFETARSDMDGLLDQAVTAAGEQTPEPVSDALFAVCAFADEAILDSAWPGRNDWMRHKMQEARFNTANAGLEFYERMDRLCIDEPAASDTTTEPDSPASAVTADRRREALEVFVACLTMGFRGKFGDAQGNKAIQQLASDNLRRLLAGSGMSKDKVFPEAYSLSLPEPEPPRLNPAIKTSILFGVPLLIAVGICVTYGGALTNFVREWLARL